MKKLSLLSIFIVFFAFIHYGQNITLTFQGQDANTHNILPLESVYIQNTTLGCDTVIYGELPSIVLTNSLGIDDPGFFGSEPFRVMSALPNPFSGSTSLQIIVNQAGRLRLRLVDPGGIAISEYENDFSVGFHRFEIKASMNKILFLIVSDGSSVKSVKLICTGSGNGENKIEYSGFAAKTLKTSYAGSGFSFQFGNQLLYRSVKAGYNDVIITDSPTQNSAYTFQLSQIVALPTVITTYVTDTSYYTATAGGNVTSDGGASVTAKGVCWSTSSNPTINDSHTVNGSGTGTFVSHLTGLTPNTSYYVRAYAVNDIGIAYGNELPFTSAVIDMLAKLVGEGNDGKVWKLIRVGSTGRYPIEVGPADHSTIWWAMGLNNNELANRACMLDDQWTFKRDGSMIYEAGPAYWAEGGVFDPANFCAGTSDPMININGEDCSAWGSGTHQFELLEGEGKLRAIGAGAFIGFYKVGNDYEVYDLTPMVQDEITYTLIKLSDAEDGTDTLIVEMKYYDNPGDVNYLGYWRHVLVHYDNPEDEPDIPTPMPVAGFTYEIDGLTVYFTNTSTFANNYVWDFGDGATSIQTDPVHVYPGDGSYNVYLTATNANGDNTISQTIIFSSVNITEEILTAGPWKLQVTDHACYVGPGLGSDAWWITPLANLDGTMVGTTDDWSCMTDDEFIFTAGGAYEYKTNGGSRNDGYMGTPNGCWSDAEISASPGAPFGSCATHTFAFTPAFGASRAIIELTNGPGFAAFLGFMKGYYGGENTNGLNPPNGGFATNRYEVIAYANNGVKEILIVSVDISADHSGTAAWTMELERPVTDLTEEILTAGPWKLQVTDHACYVGPGLGSDAWWITPLANLDGTMVGTPDDWSCMTDDEFIFTAWGAYEYKTNGSSRNDGYMGTPNGCWSDAEIAASPGAPFGSCATHTFAFTPADGTSRAIITLTNGPGFAAFLGFMKGYYGGENLNNSNPPNGGFATNRYEVIAYANDGVKEILIVSVDISADHSGSAAWTMELER